MVHSKMEEGRKTLSYLCQPLSYLCQPLSASVSRSLAWCFSREPPPSSNTPTESKTSLLSTLCRTWQPRLPAPAKILTRTWPGSQDWIRQPRQPDTMKIAKRTRPSNIREEKNRGKTTVSRTSEKENDRSLDRYLAHIWHGPFQGICRFPFSDQAICRFWSIPSSHNCVS